MNPPSPNKPTPSTSRLPIPSTSLYDIDVVIPFCKTDAHLVNVAIASILVQVGVSPLVHVVADNCEFPDNLPNKECIQYYRTDSTLGPGCIANAVVAYHAVTPYLALQDADDISFPTRLIKQLDKLRNGFDQVSAAMIQKGLPGYKGNRHIEEPILKCGGTFGNVPKGRLINSTRAVSIEMFKRINGFCELMCSQDLALDNVTSFLGIPTYCFEEPLATRRLHPDSLTNGPHFTRDKGSGGQEVLRRQRELLNQIRNSPTYNTARSQGCLDKAKPLCQIANIYSKESA